MTTFTPYTGRIDATLMLAAKRYADECCRVRETMINAERPTANYRCRDEEWSEFYHQYLDQNSPAIRTA